MKSETTLTPATAARTSATATTPFRRFLGSCYYALCRPQPASAQLRRYQRAVRFYCQGVQPRIRLHRTMIYLAAIVTFVDAIIVLLYYRTNFLRPLFDVDTWARCSAIIVISQIIALGILAAAGSMLHEIYCAAREFGDFYSHTVNSDGTITVDPTSEHDFGDRVMENGRVYVTMREVYGWWSKADDDPPETDDD